MLLAGDGEGDGAQAAAVLEPVADATHSRRHALSRRAVHGEQGALAQAGPMAGSR